MVRVPQHDTIHGTYVTPNKAARLLGVSPQTVRGMVRSGKLEAVKMGWQILIPYQAVENCMQENRFVERPRRLRRSGWYVD